MSRLFISHSSKDEAAAIALKDWLVAQGWGDEDDIFLDLDPQRGLVGGERWKEALRRNIRRCEAVIFVITPAWRASEWCLAEYQLAESFHKPIFGVITKKFKLADLPGNMAADWQVVNLTRAGEQKKFFVTAVTDGKAHEVSFNSAELTRLKAGLVNTGVDPRYFEWPPQGEPDRAPYLGLKALQKEDAGIFFGRDGQIVEALDRLRGLHEGPPPRMLVILGASGAGKSSFMRAGVLPRLERDDRHFTVFNLVRPGERALTGDTGLIASIEVEAKLSGLSLSRNDITKTVMGAVADDTTTASVDPLKELLRSIAANRSSEDAASTTSIVLPVDQMEELYFAGGNTGSREAEQLRALLTELTTCEDLRLIVLATIRSDSYEHIQFDQVLGSVDHQTMSLPPIPQGSYSEIIRGPIRRLANTDNPLKIDDRLVEELLKDIAEGGAKDALPLLAFTLERLYTEYTRDNALRLSDYEEMGRIRGSIEKAVEQAFAKADVTITADPDQRLKLLRHGLIPWLARVDPETSEPMRRIAPYTSIPETSRPLIDLLVEQRLLSIDTRLVKDNDGQPTGETEVTIEPTHEALLRQWGRLEKWLDEDKELLSALDAVKQASREWDANNKQTEWLAHMSGRLETALSAASQERFANFLDPLDTNYLQACTTEDRKRRNAEIEAQKKITRRTRIGAIAASVLMVVAAGLGWYGLEQAKVTKAQNATLADRNIEIGALNKKNNAYIVDVLLGDLEKYIYERSWSKSKNVRQEIDKRLAAVKSMESSHERQIYRRNVLSALLEKYDQSVGNIRLQGDVISADDPFPDAIIKFSPDKKKIVVSYGGTSPEIWDAKTSEKLITLSGHTAPVTSIYFNPVGDLIATASDDLSIRIWRVDTGAMLAELTGHTDEIEFAKFSNERNTLISYSHDDTIRTWNFTDQQQVSSYNVTAEYSRTVIYDRSTNLAVIAADKDGISVIDGTTLELVQFLDVEKSDIGAISIDAGLSVLVAAHAGKISVWTIKNWQILSTVSDVPTSIDSLHIDPSGSRLVATYDKRLRVWETRRWRQAADMNIDVSARKIRFLNERLVLVDDRNSPLALWDIEASRKVYDLEELHHIDGFDVGNDRLATIARDKFVKTWNNLDLQNNSARLYSTLDSRQYFEGLSSSVYRDPITIIGSSGSSKIASAVLSAHGSRIISLSADKKARIWDVKSGKLIKIIDHEYDVHNGKIVYRHDLPFALIKRNDGLAVLIDATNGVSKVFDIKIDGLWSTKFNFDGTLVGIKNEKEEVFVKNVITGETLWSKKAQSGDFKDFAFTKEVDHILLSTTLGSVQKWDMLQDEMISSIKVKEDLNILLNYNYNKNSIFITVPIGKENGTSISIDADTMKRDNKNKEFKSKTIGEILSSENSPIIVFNTNAHILFWPQRGKVWVFDEHAKPPRYPLPMNEFVFDVDMSSDGKFLATSSELGEVSVWDLSTKRQTAVIVDGKNLVTDVQFSPDGKRLLTLSDTGVAKVWKIDNHLVIPLAAKPVENNK